uniref:G protein-coupled receptor n=1 Tax=Globodera pallida TaxID=36090 RepID=A0A183BTR9_GLOPA
MASENFEAIGTVYSFFVFNRNSLVHVLIIERVLATIMVKSYERKRKPYFALVWLAVLLSLSLYNSISYRMKELSILLTNVALLSSAAIELYLFSLLRKYSAKAYRQSLKGTAGHHLSERYQLSENVRIGKQLIPTLVVHPLNIMSSTLTTSWNYFGIPGANYVMVSCATFSSFCSLLIEISIIICHPFLKRDFDRLVNSFIFRSRISENVAADSVTRIAMTNILSGERLVTGQRQEEHFEMLRKLWN